MQTLLRLYQNWTGQAPYKIEQIPQSGSNRKYVRIFDFKNQSVIGVIGESEAENKCFISLSQHFRKKGLPVPEIYIASEDNTCYLQQDLGTQTLYDYLKEARDNDFNYTTKEKEVLSQTIRLLAHIQVKGAEDLDFNKCIPPIAFDQRAAMFDLNYFKYSFLKAVGLPFDEILLENDLQQMANDLAKCANKRNFFLYRDFQARNVMLHNGTPFFIDFQGGMKGPLQYDIASFLWQASAKYPEELKEHLIQEYINEIKKLLSNFKEEEFRRDLQKFVLFRILQVLGAYGLRGYVEHKAYFLHSIPLAIQNLHLVLLNKSASPYPYLQQILEKLVILPQFHLGTKTRQQSAVLQHENKGLLVVTIYSFSYKKGIPEDKTGNGGGYVFDCRSTHNPGRYEPYKKLNGLDKPVIEFLEKDGEILEFLDSIYKLADTHVKRYIDRGFTSLMFSFGCTGGQHRSVYSAQHLAEHISQKFGIRVNLCHREQNISQVFEAQPSNT